MFDISRYPSAGFDVYRLTMTSNCQWTHVDRLQRAMDMKQRPAAQRSILNIRAALLQVFLHRSAGSYWTWSAIDQTWTAWWFDVPGSQMRLCQSKKLCPIPRKDIDRAAVIRKPPLGKPRSRIEQVSRWVLSADGLTRYHRYVISVSIHHDIYLGYKMRSSTVTPRLIFYFRLACTMVDMISTTYGALLLGSSLAYSFVLVSARFCRYWTEVNRLTGVLCFQCATYFKLYREDRHVIKYLVRFLTHFACSISLCHFTRYRSFGSSNCSIRV